MRSWFNRRSSSVVSNALGSTVGLNSGIQELSSALRTEFVSWANEAFTVNSAFSYLTTTSGNALTAQFSIDGNVVGNNLTINGDASGRVLPWGGPAYSGLQTEGHHVASVWGSVSSGSASIYSNSSYAGVVTQ